MIGEERWKPMYQILLVDDDPHILGQHRTIWQEHSAKDFASYESYKRAGILYVFPPFITARMGQKIGRRPQTQLCGDALEVNAAYLKQQGYQVFCARDGRSALSIAKSAALDGVILDVDMPGLDGVTVCQRLREMSGVPVLFLSAYVKADDRIRGLLAGGDDYLAKPYSLVELELRLRLRIEGRQRFSRQEVLRFGELEIDLGLREVRFGSKQTSFTALEFDLLAFLAQHPGQVFSYAQLSDQVWRAPINQGLHNIQVCMARVRQKLDALCPGQHHIETIRRKGYCFQVK